MADPVWKQQIRWIDEYQKIQDSVPGGLIDPNLYNILSGNREGVGTGPITLGSGFTQEERMSLAFLGNERSRRQALKRQFEIAKDTKEYGSTGDPVGDRKSSERRDKKKKLRALNAGQTLLSDIRGFTPTGALLSRGGAMRIARSKAKSAKAK